MDIESNEGGPARLPHIAPMRKPHPNDISIGQDKWITFVDISDRPYERAVSIDHLLSPMETFWTALETNCVAGCCGIDAFSLWPKDIESASREKDRQAIASSLESLRDFVERSSADTFVSSRLNNLFDKRVLLQLIHHIQSHVANRG